MDVGIGREDLMRGGALDGEAVAFMMDIGMCPGNSCPLARSGCDPRCPALVAWVEEVMDG